MDAASYIATFASILFGFAVGDLLLDLDRLLSRRREVTWHALPLIAALMITIALIAGWWDLYYALTRTQMLTIGDFLPFFVKLTIMFLIAAATLPSHSSDRLDLKRYYYQQSRYLYSLWCLLLVVILATVAKIHGIGALAQVGLVYPRLAAFAVLAWTRIPWVHWTLVPMLTAMSLWMWVANSL